MLVIFGGNKQQAMCPSLDFPPVGFHHHYTAQLKLANTLTISAWLLDNWILLILELIEMQPLALATLKRSKIFKQITLYANSPMGNTFNVKASSQICSIVQTFTVKHSEHQCA